MPYKPVQLLTPHRSDCHLRREPFDRIWVCPDRVGYGQVKRDLSGRNNARARHEWLRYRCNNAECHAALIVYLPMIDLLVQRRWRELQAEQ